MRAIGLWLSDDVPKRGWFWRGLVDLGKPAEICQMCEAQQIRYVHIVTHHEYPSELRVGCVCAENLTDNRDEPRRTETDARNTAARERRAALHEAEMRAAAEAQLASARVERERRAAKWAAYTEPQRRAKARERWATDGWYESFNRNLIKRTGDVRCTVYRSQGGWRWVYSIEEKSRSFGTVIFTDHVGARYDLYDRLVKDGVFVPLARAAELVR